MKVANLILNIKLYHFQLIVLKEYLRKGVAALHKVHFLDFTSEKNKGQTYFLIFNINISEVKLKFSTSYLYSELNFLGKTPFLNPTSLYRKIILLVTKPNSDFAMYHMCMCVYVC